MSSAFSRLRATTGRKPCAGLCRRPCLCGTVRNGEICAELCGAASGRAAAPLPRLPHQAPLLGQSCASGGHRGAVGPFVATASDGAPRLQTTGRQAPESPRMADSDSTRLWREEGYALSRVASQLRRVNCPSRCCHLNAGRRLVLVGPRPRKRHPVGRLRSTGQSEREAGQPNTHGRGRAGQRTVGRSFGSLLCGRPRRQAAATPPFPRPLTRDYPP